MIKYLRALLLGCALASVSLASALATPYSINSYTGDGSTAAYAVSFPYIQQSDVQVLVNGVVQATTTYSFTSPSTITFNSAPTAGAKITVERSTTLAANDVSFLGGALSSIDLNLNNTQWLYLLQERADTGVSVPVTDGGPMALPSATTRANSLLGFDASGNPVAFADALATGSIVPPFNIAVAPTVFNLTDQASTQNTLFALLTTGGQARSIAYNRTNDYFSMAGALLITPPAGTIEQALHTSASSPSSGSAPGPLLFNELDCNSNWHTTGADNRTACEFIQFNDGGANDIGRKVGLFVNGNHNVASSTGQDHQAISAQEYTNVADTSGGNEYAIAGSVVADNGANVLAIVAEELDDTILTGATVPARFGMRCVNNGNLQAAGVDDSCVAISSAQSTGQYKHFILETNFMGFAGLNSSSDWFASDITETVANWANLPNETVTGWIMRFPNWTVTGNGDEILNSINTNAATRTTQIGAGTTSGQVTIGGGSDAVVINGLTTAVQGGVQINKSQAGSTTEIGNGSTSGLISIGGGSNSVLFGSPITGTSFALNKNASTNTTEIGDGSTTGQITIGGSLSQVALIQATMRAQGSSTNDSAAAGYYGEYVESSLALGSATALTTSTPKTVTSISLTAGDWQVCGNLALTQNGSTVLTVWAGGISLTNNTLPTSPNGGAYFNSYPPSTAGLNPAHPVGCMRQSLSATTTVYLVAQATFATSTSSAYGDIWARRAR